MEADAGRSQLEVPAVTRCQQCQQHRSQLEVPVTLCHRCSWVLHQKRPAAGVFWRQHTAGSSGIRKLVSATHTAVITTGAKWTGQSGMPQSASHWRGCLSRNSGSNGDTDWDRGDGGDTDPGGGDDVCS